MTRRIVTRIYRYKRPPEKRTKAAGATTGRVSGRPKSVKPGLSL
jgi:hypothetical protein